jgi:hypothetical protein
MDKLNALLTPVGDVLLAPFRNYPATGLVFWSVVTGIIMTYVFGKTSNQRALRRAADNIRAQLLAVKLFKDDLVVTFHCQVKLLRATAMRLLHSVPPMLVMIVPLMFVLTQLAMRYEFRPLIKDEQAVVAMHIRPDAWKASRDMSLDSGDGFVVETESLRDEKSSTIYWRVRADGDQSKLLKFKIGDQVISKELPMSGTSSVLQVSNPKRAGVSALDQLLYPAELSLSADSPIESIDIQLTPRENLILGWRVPWWATFFIVSMFVAFVTGKFMGVQY